MNIITNLSIPIYEFWCPDEIIVNVKSSLASMEWTKNVNNEISVDRNINNDFLISWINSSLAEISKHVYPDVIAKLNVESLWITKTHKNSFHHTHSHPNSICSGILYLDDSKNGGNTRFYMPDPWWKFHNDGLFNFTDRAHEQKEMILGEVIPKIGKMIIFPSHIKHSVTPNLDINTRYTVAFNSFFRGIIGNGFNGSAITI